MPASTLERALLPPLTGTTRCFLFGCVAGKLAAWLRFALRPGAGDLVRKPLALGAALAGLCATFHVTRLALKRTGLLYEPRRSAASGAIAGCALACLKPTEVAAHTELHTAITVSAAHLARALRHTRP
eukprot:4630679-Prymnesium_polylepis.1